MKDLLPAVMTKMSGAGNTFVLIDARPGSVWSQIEKEHRIVRSDFAKTICDSIIGIGADGLLFILQGSSGFDFDWDFYNSDGSTAEMCGNAARCAARFCSETLTNNKQLNLRFKTGAGLVRTEITESGEIKVVMPEVTLVQSKIELKTPSAGSQVFTLVNTGVPHLVQKLSDLKQTLALRAMAKEARSHSDLGPAGANVTFFAETAVGSIEAVTFERGVEDYTQACGTGAVAAAFVHASFQKLSEVSVKMPGGKMKVVFENMNSHPLLIGDAVFVGEFKSNLEVLK